MKVDSIEINSGETIVLTKLTVLVGANNVGKSRTLKDIRDLMVLGKNSKPVIVKKININKPPIEELFEGLIVRDHPNAINLKIIKSISSNLSNSEEFTYDPQTFSQQYSNNAFEDVVLGNLTKFRVAHLDSSTRLNLALSTASFNPALGSPEKLLQSLYLSPETEEILKKAFVEAFESEIKLDYSELVAFSLRVAKNMPIIPDDPQKAYPITRNLEKIDEQGDGYRSFVGIIIGLLLSKDRIILLDEPEAFLHPAQARYLGKWIIENVDKFDGQIIIATHNSNFLSGILSTDRDVDIYRLNRKENSTIFNLISAETNKKLSKSPLLSSQRVLEAIFHKGVVVCEADADRAIYQGVSLIELNNQEILFIHAHNKQTLKDVAIVLKEAKIPTSIIVDIDILNSTDDFKNLLKSLTNDDIEQMLEVQKVIGKSVSGEPDAEILKSIEKSVEEYLKQLKAGEHTLSGAKGAINRIYQGGTKWSLIKKNGIEQFSQKIKTEVMSLINKVKEVGLFIVPVGELEGWIDVGTTQKNKWIISALEVVYEKKSPKNLKLFIKEVVDNLNNL